MKNRVLFIVGLLFAATPLASPPVALALGLMFGLFFAHPFRAESRKVSKYLLQLCVIGLGFGMNLQDVLHAGRTGFAYTAAGIAFALAFGLVLGRWLHVKTKNAFLIAVGTAICGGSAIAAIGPVAEASDEEMSVSLGTVFILNSVALIVFPLVGALVGLSQTQFGLWAALAIHDTSSVVGAAAKYGTDALAVGTTVKLARALWIVPVALGVAAIKHSGARIQWPWFVLFFVAAAVVATYFPAAAPVYTFIKTTAKIGLTVTLYLIGSGITRASLKAVGMRPLLQGAALWLTISLLSLALIRAGVIGL